MLYFRQLAMVPMYGRWKMKKKDIESLITILEDMKKTQEFILDTGTVVSRPFSSGSIAINKQVGSGLCYLYNAINRLSGLIEQVSP